MSKLKINQELAKVFNQSDIKDHAKKKSMWGGSFEPSPHDEYIFDEESQKFIMKTITYADSLYKSFDEVLVNVVDVHVKHQSLAKKYRVTQCIIDFGQDGYISIYNNGQGIPVDVVKDLKGNPIYIPQLISTEFLAGSNNAEDKDRITGGVNGIGLSMVFNNSTHTVLETMDIERKKHYVQETYDRLKKIGEPIISTQRKIPTTDRHKKGGTTIKFKPAYDAYQFNMKQDYDDLSALFKARAIQIAAHTGMEIVYNGVNVLPGKNKMQDFASMYMKESIYTNIKHEKYPWDVIIGISNTGKFESTSVINGVCVKTGNHIDYIKEYVITELRPIAEKLVKKYREFKKSMIYNHMFVIISGNIPNPSFDSQTKTNISGSMTKYKEYGLKPTEIKKIWKMFEPILTYEYMTAPSQMKKKTRATTTGIKKYKAAKFAGKNKGPCTLLVCEGDSAESMTKTALVSKDVDLNYDYFGTFNIGGVPINARTKTKPYKKRDGTMGYRREMMLTENERWSSFERVMNLNHNCTYVSDAEFKTLNYQCITMTVDQDLDGVGQICGLMLSNIHRFWPELIRRGIVKQFETPIKRVYPRNGGGRVVSFYTEEEYQRWVQKKFSGVEPTSYEIKYYKGLATHNDDEAIHMFKHYDKHLYTFTHDDAADLTFDIYYGNNPDLRKIELVKPLESKDDLLYAYTEENGLSEEMQMPSSIHLKTHTKEFQLDNIMRKLPNVYDGLNPARRKSLCGARKRFLHNNKEIKVFQLAGYIAEHMNYHHGGASLESTLINMAQNYVGANNYPLLLPLSQFGCLDPETPILMWKGIKKAKDIIVGDKLIGDDGTPRNVLSITSGQDEMYEITNGDLVNYTVNSQHILTLCLTVHKKIWWKESSKSWTVMYFDKNSKTVKSKTVRTSDPTNGNYYNKSTLNKDDAYNLILDHVSNISDNNIIDIKIQDYINLPNYVKSKLKGTINQSVIQWIEQKVDIDPYTLGMWLGDDMSDCHAFASIDDELIKSDIECQGFRKHGRPTNINPFKELMKRNELFKNKYVPTNYIYNTENVRLNILAGMIDTNGSLKKQGNIYQYQIYQSEKHKDMVESFRIIAGSLGYRANILKHGNMLTLCISGYGLEKIPTRLTKKQINTQYTNHMNPMCHKIQIRPIGKGFFCGWSVDKNERFLLNDFTITHNSRMKGGKDAGAPRYIKTKLNRDLVAALFRSDDDYIIQYTSDEGEINEPVNYIPVAPFVLMESLELPASGWKYCGYARQWDALYANIKSLLNYSRDGAINLSLIKPMPFEAHNWKGNVRKSNSKNGVKQWAMGTYVFDSKRNTVEITELPYQTWNQNFEDSLDKKKHVLSVDDKSSKLQINIQIKLRPDSFAKIQEECKKGDPEFDVIEDYLGLKTKLDQHLNMIKNGMVKEYDSYEAVLYDWFIERFNAYKRRFERLAVIIRLRILMLKQIIKFVEDRKKYNFSNIDEERADAIMQKDKFIRFNKGLLENPKFTPINKIESLVKGDEAPGASYDYLYSIPPKQQMEAARQARTKKLKDLEDYYKHITHDDIIKTTWTEELQELDNVIRKARANERGWLYGESKAKLV